MVLALLTQGHPEAKRKASIFLLVSVCPPVSLTKPDVQDKYSEECSPL